MALSRTALRLEAHEGAAAREGTAGAGADEREFGAGAFRLALAQSGITKPATPHTLRHSYATHLLEEGVSIRFISQYLGHSSLDITVIYTHLTACTEERTREALAKLHMQTSGGSRVGAAQDALTS